MSRQGNYRRGLDNARCHHSDRLVAEVRARYRPGEFGMDRVAREFGLPRTTVRDWLSYATRAEAKPSAR